MNKTAANQYACQLEVVSGSKLRHDADVMSWIPFKLHIVVSHWRLPELDSLLVSKEARGDDTGIRYASYERDRLLRALVGQAVSGITNKLQQVRTAIDIALTVAFASSSLIYLVSIRFGIAVDAILIATLFTVARMHNAQTEYIRALVSALFSQNTRNGGNQHD